MVLREIDQRQDTHSLQHMNGLQAGLVVHDTGMNLPFADSDII